MYSRFVNWFDSLPNVVKLVSVLATLVALPLAAILLVLLSPVVTMLALIVLLAGIYKLVRQVREHRPARNWGIAVGVSFLLLLVFSPISYALYGGAPEEQATVPETTVEEPIKEEAAPTGAEKKKAAEENANKRGAKEAAAREQAKEEAPKRRVQERTTEQQPQTLEERIRAAVSESSFNRDEIDKVSVKDDGTGCRYITVNRQEAGRWSGTPSSLDRAMQDIYIAIYSDSELSSNVCSATVNTWGELGDKYGNRWNERIYSTTLERTTANKINWGNATNNSNFPSFWTINYRHPDVERAMEKEQVERAVDCLEDEGLFDVDIGC